MKHEWENYIPPKNSPMLGWREKRKCGNCGVIQTQYTIYDWGRVIGYRWEPLAGRCGSGDGGGGLISELTDKKLRSNGFEAL